MTQPNDLNVHPKHVTHLKQVLELFSHDRRSTDGSHYCGLVHNGEDEKAKAAVGMIQKRPGDIPMISAENPLPGIPASRSRWAEPYIAEATGAWTVHLRDPLAFGEVRGRLLSTVTAHDLDTLKALMAHQDMIAERIQRAREA